jgi:GT2 family glycosyltransferase
MRPSILAIIPTYNHLDYARRCVDSYARYTSEQSTVAVVDDASPAWLSYSWAGWPPLDTVKIHFTKRDGLTRSWNAGLRLARELGATYAVCGNSDLLFSPGWCGPMLDALERYHLVGPITNAPGHCPWQSAANYGVTEISDDPRTIAANATRLRQSVKNPVRVYRINGFLLMAKTDVWWSQAYDKDNVFNPAYKLTGNEDELQRRWLAAGRKIACVPESYVFHYRSVSRPEALGRPASRGAFRP